MKCVLWFVEEVSAVRCGIQWYVEEVSTVRCGIQWCVEEDMERGRGKESGA